MRRIKETFLALPNVPNNENLLCHSYTTNDLERN